MTSCSNKRDLDLVSVHNFWLLKSTLIIIYSLVFNHKIFLCCLDWIKSLLIILNRVKCHAQTIKFDYSFSIFPSITSVDYELSKLRFIDSRSRSQLERNVPIYHISFGKQFTGLNIRFPWCALLGLYTRCVAFRRIEKIRHTQNYWKISNT